MSEATQGCTLRSHHREGAKQRESMGWRGLTGLVPSNLKLPLEPERIIGVYIVNAFPLFLWDTFLFLVF